VNPFFFRRLLQSAEERRHRVQHQQHMHDDITSPSVSPIPSRCSWGRDVAHEWSQQSSSSIWQPVLPGGHPVEHSWTPDMLWPSNVERRAAELGAAGLAPLTPLYDSWSAEFVSMESQAAGDALVRERASRTPAKVDLLNSQGHWCAVFLRDQRVLTFATRVVKPLEVSTVRCMPRLVDVSCFRLCLQDLSLRWCQHRCHASGHLRHETLHERDQSCCAGQASSMSDSPAYVRGGQHDAPGMQSVNEEGILPSVLTVRSLPYSSMPLQMSVLSSLDHHEFAQSVFVTSFRSRSHLCQTQQSTKSMDVSVARHVV
jgi:hypothetical protein